MNTKATSKAGFTVPTEIAVLDFNPFLNPQFSILACMKNLNCAGRVSNLERRNNNAIDAEF